MYRSGLDDKGKLEFPFDPLHLYHKKSNLNWPEYPYKQKTVYRVQCSCPSNSIFEIAGVLLIRYGNEEEAIKDLISYPEDKEIFEKRFLDERKEFYIAKKIYLKEETENIRKQLETTKIKNEEKEKYKNFLSNQEKIKNIHENGDLYEGEVIHKFNHPVPHGMGTLWKSIVVNGRKSIHELNRTEKYRGNWMNGEYHGKGQLFWENGDSWQGNFIKGKMCGKGIFSIKSLSTAEDRYYWDDCHISWHTDLTFGTRIGLLNEINSLKTEISLMKEPSNMTVGTIISYDSGKDLFLMEFSQSLPIIQKYIKLSKIHFQIIGNRPIAAYSE